MNDFANPTGVQWEGEGYGQVKFGNDSHTMGLFYTRSVLNTAKSRDAGRRIHENQTYVRIQQPGERLNVVDRPVQDNDKRRWPESWRAYVEGKTYVPDGTPVEMLFPNHPAVADNLKGLNIFTIEQMAVLSGNAIDAIGMGGQDWVNKAKAYLDKADKGKEFNKMAQDLEETKARERVMAQQLNQAIAQIKTLEERLFNPQTLSNPHNIQGVDPVVSRINANRAAQIDEIELPKGAIKAAKLAQKMEDPLAINTGGDDF